MALERYYAAAPVTLCGGKYLPGWTVRDHRKRDERRNGVPGAPIHEGTMDKDTAMFLADALNRGDITPDEVMNA